MLSAFLQLITSESIRSFLTEYAAGKFMDKSLEVLKKEGTIETQFMEVLTAALSVTCEHFGWEYCEELTFENFSLGWNEIYHISKSLDEEAIRALLMKTLGKEVISELELSDIFQFWLHSFYSFLCKDKYQQLHRYLTICQITALNERHKKKTTTDINVYQELVATFGQLFPESDDLKEKTLEKEENPNIVNLSLEEQVAFEDALNLLRYQSNPEFSVKNDGQAMDSNPDEICGKYFSIHNPQNTFTAIYQIDKMAIPLEHRWRAWTTRLDSAIEKLHDGSAVCTYFVDDPAPDGNHLLFINFNSKTGKIFINTGFLDDDAVLMSLKPMPFVIHRPEELIVHKAIKVIPSSDELKEFSYSYNLDHQFIILELEYGEEIKPEYRIENGSVLGRIQLVPYKKYFVFEVRSKEEVNHEMSDYDIACAYRDGTYLLERNLEKANYYFRVAEYAGDQRASMALERLEQEESY